VDGNKLFIDLLSEPFIELLPPVHDLDKPTMQEYPPKSIEVSLTINIRLDFRICSVKLYISIILSCLFYFLIFFFFLQRRIIACGERA